MKTEGLILYLSFFLTSLLLSAQGGAERGGEALILFNASSTTDLVEGLIQLYQTETGLSIHTNPASSGTLAKQLEQGAKGDIYISASSAWVDFIVKKDLVSESKILFYNSLVLAAPLDSNIPVVEICRELDLPGLFHGRLSMGDPDHVPAGVYAQQALEYYNWNNRLSRRILPAANVRSALSVIEMGETELGIIYATDALKSKKVKVLGEFPSPSHSPIGYYAVLMKDAAPGALDFYKFLTSTEANSLYGELGFLPNGQGYSW